jgi:type IV pilus assembly protein PilY1
MGKAIYMVDPFTGQRIWWASDDAGSSLPLTKMKYSIPSEVTSMDTDGDKSVDRLYVGDTGGQLWRIDLGDQIGDGTSGLSNGYVFADIGCGSTASTQRVHDAAGDCPVSTTKQDLRKFFYPPDVAQVKDATYSTSENYDLVTIGSGDREDPLDLLTSSPTTDYPVHNRIYAFRDYEYTTGAPATIPTTPLSEFEMYDATANNLGTLTGTALQTEIDDKVKNSKGWYINLVEPSAVTLLNGLSSTWVGEKVLAKTLVFGGVLYATTFVPANQATLSAACTPNEGEARAYALNYLTGEGVYDLNNDGLIDRANPIGGGIPSEVVIVIRDGGVTGLVGTSGGAAGIDVGGGLPRYKTYWYDE